MMRFIVFAPNWLGDAVMALPALADLQRTFRDASIDIAARPAIVPLFKLVSRVREVVAVTTPAQTARALRARGYDVALLLPNSFNVALIAKRAGIPERWGYRTDFRGPLLTRGAVTPTGGHQAAYYQSLVRALGCANGPIEPRLTVAEELRQVGFELLVGEGWDGHARLVAMAPGAAYGGAKRWPASSFAAVAVDLANDGVRTVLVGAAGDRTAADEVKRRASLRAPILDLVGRTDLPGLASVLVQCRAIVTNDSGAMHFAAALGVDVTAMFGPTNERETHPIGSARTTVLTHQVWCRPCMLRECPLTHRCMRGISVARVEHATRQSL